MEQGSKQGEGIGLPGGMTLPEMRDFSDGGR